MKFNRAFCKELKENVSPYVARELYFDSTSDFYNIPLTFICDSKKCEAVLTPYNIYKTGRVKQSPHFRSKDILQHGEKCLHNKANTIVNGKEKEREKEYGLKIDRLPSEFLLDRPISQKNRGIKIEVEDDDTLETTVSKSTFSQINFRKRTSKIKTSSFENIVDCYENLDENILKTETLTINGKTKKYKNFFKNIAYYQDEEGLIYYGKVKTLKKYGKNYKIAFEEKPKVDNRRMQVSIYIDEDTIEVYRKKDMFVDQLEQLLATEKSILCYFVNSYPKVENVENNGKAFTTLKVEIENLDHLTFTFNK